MTTDRPGASAPRPALRDAAWLLLLSATVAGTLSCRHTAYERPRLARDTAPWTLPLLDPLTTRSPHVYGTLAYRGTEVPVSVVVDTGAWRSTIGRATAEALGMRVRRDGGLGTIDVTGARQSWHGVILHRMVFGDLVVDGMGVSVEQSWDHAMMLLGMDVLGEVPLEVDVDRGVAILGGPPLGEALTASPIRLLGTRRVPQIDIRIDGRRIRLMLDTGASTLIDWRRAVRMKLPVVPLAEEQTRHGVRSSYAVRAVYQPVEILLGEVLVEEVSVHPLPQWRRGGLFNRPEVGLLGSDLLRRFRYRIDARARALDLSPRAATRDTASERVARWPWVPRCDDRPGCLTYDVGAPDDESRVRVTLKSSQPYDRPTAFLVAALDTEGRILGQLPAVEVMVPALEPNEAVAVTLPTWMSDELERWAPFLGAFELLDVNPLLDWETALPLTPERPGVRPRWLQDAIVFSAQGASDLDEATWLDEVAGPLVSLRMYELTRCHEEAVTRAEGPVGGEILLRWTVGPTGRVEGVQRIGGSLDDDEMIACLKRRVRRWAFPYPPDGARVVMRRGWRFAAASP